MTSGTQTNNEHREERLVSDEIPSLKEPFKDQDILKATKQLKNNKAACHDQILKEFLKNSPSTFIPIYTRLFNLLLFSRQVPDDWCLSGIMPIYKNKGSANEPNNYRDISLVSCLGKLFTSCINNRLTDFVKENDIIGPEQAGFKSDFFTIDHLFVLKSLADVYLSKRKRLYCCFVDYKKAFDTVNRSKLWTKLSSSGISGRILDVIKNMYLKAKSCVAINGGQSECFPCHIGVRQGENLSPLMFSIYLADLNNFLASKCTGLDYLNNIQEEPLNDELTTFFKLYLLMYAADTVLLAESPEDLQTSLNTMKDYCSMFDLEINIDKTKVMICSRGKLRKPHYFN